MYSSTKSPSKQAKTGDILTTKSVKRRVSEPSGQDAAPQWQELQGTAEFRIEFQETAHKKDFKHLTEPFTAAGYEWRLLVKCDRGKLHNLMVHLIAHTDTFFQARENVYGTLTLNHADKDQSIIKEFEHSFVAESRKKMLSVLNSSAAVESCPGFLDETLSAAEASWTKVPAESEAGDADIILSDVPGGCTLTAHSLYLSHASPVFREALTASAQSLREASDEPDTKPKPAGKRRKTGEAKPDVASLKPARPVLTLADTTRQQALLLLHFLYTMARESWLSGLLPHTLIDLARAAHRFECTSVLHLVDTALVEICIEDQEANSRFASCAYLTVKDAPAHFCLARNLELEDFEAHVGCFMGEHARDIDLKSDYLDKSTTAILQGACKIT